MSKELRDEIEKYGKDYVLRKYKGKRKFTPVDSDLDGYDPDIDPTVFFPEIPSPERKSKKKSVQIDEPEPLKTYREYIPEDYEIELPTKGKDDAALESLANAIYSHTGVIYGPTPTDEDLETSVKTIFNKKWLGKDPEQIERVQERRRRKEEEERKTLGRGGKKHKTHRKKAHYKKSKKNRKSKKSKKNR
jgi:hypothetical protein